MISAVSVIIPSYNHARYIREAIDSVLAQTVAPVEVIIVDDGSTDGSAEVIRAIPDKRVKAVLFEANRGACAALNEGLRQAKGDFIAICNSDDVWVGKKLEKQLGVFAERPSVDVVFTNVDFIGDDGASLHDLPFVMRNAFEPVYHNRWGWLRELIERGNRLCHPSILARRRVYETVGEYDNRLRQLPDLQMWLRILQHFDIQVMEDRLVRFRVHVGNTSAPSPGTSVRDRNEFAIIIEDFFRQLDAGDFFLTFGSTKDLKDAAWSLAVEKILYLVNAGAAYPLIFNHVGYRLAMELMATEEGRHAWQAYGFSIADFHTLHGLSSPWLSRLEPPNAAELEVARRITSSSLVEPESDRKPAQGQARRKKHRVQKVIDFVRGKKAPPSWG